MCGVLYVPYFNRQEASYVVFRLLWLGAERVLILGLPLVREFVDHFRTAIVISLLGMRVVC